MRRIQTVWSGTFPTIMLMLRVPFGGLLALGIQGGYARQQISVSSDIDIVMLFESESLSKNILKDILIEENTKLKYDIYI